MFHDVPGDDGFHGWGLVSLGLIDLIESGNGFCWILSFIE